MLVSHPYKLAVIEDDPMQIAYLKKLLSKHSEDFVVYDFSSPLEALEAIKKESIRIIITDINMPDMYGDDLLREVMSLKIGASVYILTGAESLMLANRCLENGARSILRKPITREKLDHILSDAKTHFDDWNIILRELIASKNKDKG